MQPQADPFIVPVCHDEIDILYEDDALLLINKPSGLLTLSGKHPANLDSVHYRLRQRYPDCRMLHRLDFGTSGVMLVALNKAINGLLTQQFQTGRVKKTYTAVLHGLLEADNGVVELPIAKGDFPLQKICRERGKTATTHFNVMRRSPEKNCTWVCFEPLSGRTHQLRIHSREMGHSILGCDLYANDEAYFMADRLMLHATTLSFDHPVTGSVMIGESTCPF